MKKKTDGDTKDKADEDPVAERIHAYLFVYDSSNYRTFQSMMCMVETIKELEKGEKKGMGGKGAKGGGGGGKFFPKMLIIGNKKDLRKQKEVGTVGAEDIKALDGTKIREVSALTNQGLHEAFKLLV